MQAKLQTASATRRSLLLTLGAGAIAAVGLDVFAQAAAAAGASSDGLRTLSFEVLRNGGPIGRHQVAFTVTGAQTVAEIHADFLVKFGPVPVFRYAHHAVETWRGAEFVALDSQTTTNGKRERLAARPSPTGVSLTSQTGVVVAPAGCLPMTHWRRGSLERGLLFNPQTGEVMREAVTRADDQTVALANGERKEATRYSLSGKAEMSDWYDDHGVWTALDAKAMDGSRIAYRLLDA